MENGSWRAITHSFCWAVQTSMINLRTVLWTLWLFDLGAFVLEPRLMHFDTFMTPFLVHVGAPAVGTRIEHMLCQWVMSLTVMSITILWILDITHWHHEPVNKLCAIKLSQPGHAQIRVPYTPSPLHLCSIAAICCSRMPLLRRLTRFLALHSWNFVQKLVHS